MESLFGDLDLTSPMWSFNCLKHYCMRMKPKYLETLNEAAATTDEDVKPQTEQLAQNSDQGTSNISHNAQSSDAQDDDIKLSTLVRYNKTSDQKQTSIEPPYKKPKNESEKAAVEKKEASKKGKYKLEKPVAAAKRHIPDEQRHKLPNLNIFGNRRSHLTIKQHDIHLATMLNYAKLNHYLSAQGKEHEVRKKLLKEEHDIFNECVKELAKANPTFMKRFRVPYQTFSLNKGHFSRKVTVINEKYPKKYKYLSHVELDRCLRDSRPTAELTYERLLLETGRVPKIILPNMEKRFFVEPVDITRKSMDRSESVFLCEDANIDRLIDKYAPNFVMCFSGAKALLSGFGPLNSHDWMLPVFIHSRFVQGRQSRVAYVLKPLPVKRIDSVRVQMHRFKKALKAAFGGDKGARPRRFRGDDDSAATRDADADDLFGGCSVDVDSAETFGSDDWLARGAPATARSAAEAGAGGTATPKPKSQSATTNSNESETDEAGIVERSNAVSSAKKSIGASPYAKRGHETSKRAVESSSDAEPSSSGIRTRSSSQHFEEGGPPPSLGHKFGQSKKDAKANKTVWPDLRSSVDAQSTAAVAFDDVLGQILTETDFGAKNKTPKQKVPQKKPLVDPNEAPCENLHEYRASEPDEKLTQYSMWRMKDFGILLRSNISGCVRATTDFAKKFQGPARASFLPQLEFESEYGAQSMLLEEKLNHWWTAFLKRSFVHLIARINPTSFDLLALNFLYCEHYLRESSMDPDTKLSVHQGLSRLSRILSELYALEDDGWYLLKSEFRNGDFEIKILQETEEEISKYSAEDSIDLSQEYDSRWFSQYKMCDIQDFDELWRPIDPNAVLQYHRIMKRIPATFLPRRPDEKPQMQNTLKPKGTAGAQTKKKKKKNKNKANRDFDKAKAREETEQSGSESE